MAKLFLPYFQAPGVGQGYFVNANFPGSRAIVEVENFLNPVRLVITRYNAPNFEADIPSGSEFAVEITNIQTIGILALPGAFLSSSGIIKIKFL